MTAKTDFLVEIGTEELPPKALRRLSDAFVAGLRAGLDDAALGYGTIAGFATPRRLAVQIDALDLCQADKEIERKGPPVKIAYDADGQPTKAALKFAESCGIEPDEIDTVKTNKGEWLFFSGTQTGATAASLLPNIVAASLDALPIPKRMRWGASDAEFVRPVHWVVMLLGAEVVPAEILGITSGRSSRGHRFHGSGPIDLARPDGYALALEQDGRVLADFAARRARIEALVKDAAGKHNGTAVGDDALYDEVTALVEWPVAVTGEFEKRYLELPPEVLISTLQDHQRYFPIAGPDGKLLPAFVTISNIESREPDAVKTGNEKVVRPRLADAAFFWDVDRNTSLVDRVDRLKGVVFQKKLGTVWDKSERVAALAADIAGQLGGDSGLAKRAALLAKTDLVTDMVGEFPELQGVMGRYYALHDGEPTELAEALAEQYLPRFSGDDLPKTRTGRALALADKLDTIAAIFAIGQKPTGTRDPFGLRRAAIGVLRILIESGVDLDLDALVREAAAALSGLLHDKKPAYSDSDALAADVLAFMTERLRAYYLDDSSFTPGMFEAVVANRPTHPLDFHQRMLAVREFLALDASASLTAANKRIANILSKAKETVPDEVAANLLTDAAEKQLYEQLSRLRRDVAPLLSARRYGAALAELASLKEPVDSFFDSVLVMAEDDALRGNRLALLTQLRRLFLHTADFSKAH